MLQDEDRRLAAAACLWVEHSHEHDPPSRQVERLGRRVLTLWVVDNSPFSPIRLTVPSDSPYDQEAHAFSHFKQRG